MERRNRARRFVPFAIFFIISAIVFVGGSTALLYLLFSEYSGIRNIWLLICGAPVILILLIITTVVNLYRRFGKPLDDLFSAINAVGEGDLSVRVPEVNSDMFSELIKRFNKMIGELERNDKQRRNLTADIAHELRTPLHIIQGNLEGILDGVYQPTTEHINNTLDETRLLNRLVNDLQTLSLAESGQLPLHRNPILLADLLDDLTSSFSPQASSIGINFQTRLSDPNLEIIADYDRLNQALSNLISNAIRHTPKHGKILVDILEVDERIQIKVEDSGSGISTEDLPFIFDRFWRGDRSRTERTHSGLGLAITKQLIQAHGGQINAESEIGKGTKFIIDLPISGMDLNSQPSDSIIN